MSSAPCVTIITTVLNECEALKKTIDAVSAQDYPNIEYIVIDGGSTDGTVNLIQSHPAITKAISEPDRGIADGFNKGIAIATGDYITFQGAGDYFWSNDSLSRLMTGVDTATVDLICGQIIRVDELGRKLWTAPKTFQANFRKKKLLMKMALPHQGLLTHKRFFNQFGLFDTSLQFAMDYELLLRAYHRFPTIITKNIPFAAWRAGGVGTGRYREVLAEYHKIKKQHQVAAPMVLELIHSFCHFKRIIKQTIGYAV